MMRMLGAGLPRTGTSSLREALRQLLGGEVYHMREAFARPEHVPTWVAAMQGDPPDWDVFLADYVAGLDAPFSDCWRSLADAYPEAPVLLSHRGDRAVWFASMESTVLPRIRAMVARDDDDPLAPLFRVMSEDFFGRDADLDDPEVVMGCYDRRWTEVHDVIAPDRLVVWQPGDGWGPLAQALDVAAPTEPFPHENTRAEFVQRVAESEQRAAEREQRAAED